MSNVVPIGNRHSAQSRARRDAVGASAEQLAVARIEQAVPGRLVVYRNVILEAEVSVASGDLDLLVLTGRAVFAIGVTSSCRSVFTRGPLGLAGTAGSERQVRQLGKSFRVLGASCLGRMAALNAVPLHAILALDGEISPRLAGEPWFDIAGNPPVEMGIAVVHIADLGGFVRGLSAPGVCRPLAITEMERHLDRTVRYGTKMTRSSARHTTCGHRCHGR